MSACMVEVCINLCIYQIKIKLSNFTLDLNTKFHQSALSSSNDD
jgi:hypothetical protein